LKASYAESVGTHKIRQGFRQGWISSKGTSVMDAVRNFVKSRR
jgi:hypothetical protein